MTDATDDSTLEVDPPAVAAGALTMNSAWAQAESATWHVTTQSDEQGGKWGEQWGAVDFRNRYVGKLTDLSDRLGKLSDELDRLTGFLFKFNNLAAAADGATRSQLLTKLNELLSGEAPSGGGSPEPAVDPPVGY